MALQSDLDDQGGVLVASEQYADRFNPGRRQRCVHSSACDEDAGYQRGFAGYPDAGFGCGRCGWTAEIATGSEDTGMKFGKRELRPHPLAKRIKISKKLLRLVPTVEAKVMERLAYKFGIAQEKGFLTGNGVNQPPGCLHGVHERHQHRT